MESAQDNSLPSSKDPDSNAQTQTQTPSSTAAPPPGPLVTIKRPIVFTTPNYGSYIYDIDTQSYYTQFSGTWVLLHQTPQTTIPKSTARQYLKKFPSISEAAALFNIQPSPHPILSHQILVYNALHDSILVQRDKSTTGLLDFYADKLPTPYITSIPLLAQYLRPELMTGHQCTQLQTYGPVIYCPTCTVWNIPVAAPSPPQQTDGTPQQQQQQKQQYTPLPLGRLTFSKPVADAIATLYCADAKSGKFNIDATFTTLNSLFRLVDLSAIPVPKELVIQYVFRDCLFVRKFDGKVVSWGEHFRVKDRSAFAIRDALTIVRIGLAIGTLGAVS